MLVMVVIVVMVVNMKDLPVCSIILSIVCVTNTNFSYNPEMIRCT